MPSPEASNDDVRGVRLGWAQDGMGEWWYVDEGPMHPATHVAHSLAPEAQAARREAVVRAFSPYTQYRGEPLNDIADAVLRVLGLST